MKSADGSEWWNKNGFKWVFGQNWACDKMRLKNCFWECVQLFSTMFSSKPKSLHATWTPRSEQTTKSRLRIIIDLLTLFPASDFLPLPKQTIDFVYFLGYSRFAAVWLEAFSGRTVYLFTGPHLGYVTSAQAPHLRDFVFSYIQKWTERTKGQGSLCGPLLSRHKSI